MLLPPRPVGAARRATGTRSPSRTTRCPTGGVRHARRAHLDLIDLWGPPRGTWLKTDLFEERSTQRALLPDLTSARWVGMDLSPSVGRQARARTGCSAVVADVRGLPFPAASFDGVLSTSTLDHFAALDDVHRSLGELRHVCGPGVASCSPSTIRPTR